MVYKIPSLRPMLSKIAWEYTRLYPVQFDEAKSQAYWCFLKACRSFRPGKGSKFSTWCYFVVSLNMKTWISQEAKRSSWLKITEFVPEQPVEDPPRTLSQIHRDPPRHVGQIIWRMIHETPNEMWDLMNELSRDGQELVLLLLEIPQDFRGTASVHLNRAKVKLARRQRSQDRVEKAVQELGAALLSRFCTCH